MNLLEYCAVVAFLLATVPSSVIAIRWTRAKVKGADNQEERWGILLCVSALPCLFGVAMLQLGVMQATFNEERPLYAYVARQPFTSTCGISGYEQPGPAKNCFERKGLRVWALQESGGPMYYVGEIQLDGQVVKTIRFAPDEIPMRGADAIRFKSDDINWPRYLTALSDSNQTS